MMHLETKRVSRNRRAFCHCSLKRVSQMAILAGVALSTLAAAAAQANDQNPAADAADGEWKIVITPRPKRSTGQPDKENPLAVAGSYGEVYRSIPFSRTEYLANPSFRHEAAMEILFGELRPMTIYKNVPPPAQAGAAFNYVTPYRYSHGRRRASYNFFYPFPSGYRWY